MKKKCPDVAVPVRPYPLRLTGEEADHLATLIRRAVEELAERPVYAAGVLGEARELIRQRRMIR